jgi:pimeloyl-ACP methyl ester carboxylesterase
MLSILRCSAFLVVAALATGASARSSAVHWLSSKTCRIEGVALPVRCGILEVEESAASRRSIGVYFVVVPAASRNTGAIFQIFGGPGQSALEAAAGRLGGSSPLQSLVAMHAHHDIVFADQRGTGRSHPLQCPDLYASRQSSFEELYPSAPLRACRARLAKSSDLNAYGTRQAVDDLEALRAALGYRTVSIDTGSYGSQVAFEYMRRHPSSLRAVLLEAVVPTYAKVPLPFTRAAQTALTDLEASCESDAACHNAFPAFTSEWNLVNARFARAPQLVTFQDGQGVTSARLSREVFADSVRHALYDPFFAAALPAAIHSAAQGDYGSLAKLAAAQIDGFKNELYWGMFLSVTCSEDVAFITPQERASAAGAGFLGDLRIRSQQRACAIWNVRRVPEGWIAPVRSDVPVLMISGADDPAAPAWLGASQLPYLSSARQVIVAHGGHNNEDACLARVRVAFIDDPDPRRIHDTCGARYARPPFALNFDAWYAKYFSPNRNQP